MPKRASITYKCSGTCTASDLHKHIKVGTILTMKAKGTSVTLTFVKSPFASGRKTVNIPANSSVKDTIGEVRDEFKYRIRCASCPSGDDDPSYIVEL